MSEVMGNGRGVPQPYVPREARSDAQPTPSRRGGPHSPLGRLVSSAHAVALAGSAPGTWIAHPDGRIGPFRFELTTDAWGPREIAEGGEGLLARRQVARALP